MGDQLRDQRNLRKAYDRAIQKQLRRLGRPSKRREAAEAKDREKKFKAIADADPEFYVLHRSINLSATWLSIVAATLLMDVGHPDNKGEASDEQVAALAFFSRLANDLWAIIELVERGFDLQARALARSYLEHVDVLICCIHDIELTKEFVEAIEPDESNRFWHKNVSKNKIKKRTASLIAGMLRVPDTDLVDALREPAEAAGSALHHPTVLAGLSAAFGSEDVDYGDTYPIFPVPVAASGGIFRILLTHLFWLFLAMGPLPKSPNGAWGSLLQNDEYFNNRFLNDLQRINREMLGFLLENELFIKVKTTEEALTPKA
jgi:hypothetical protein